MRQIKRTLLMIIAITLLVVIVGCTPREGNATKLSGNEKLTVGVSIIPEATFVKVVGGERVDVVTMIPPGNSPSNYQPTPRQMEALSNAKLYFTIGVPAEKSFIEPKLLSLNKDIIKVDLFHQVDEVYEARYFEEEVEKEEDNHQDEESDHDHTGADPHIWLSPKRVLVMIDAIVEHLSQIDPEGKELYTKNGEKYKRKIKDLDSYIEERLRESKDGVFIIYHPSLGYYADDYGLKMIAIEAKGKEATAKEMAKVIDFAKEKNIKVVFYQSEFSSKQAKIIANDINGDVLQINILAEDYVDNLKVITDTLAKNLTK